MKVWQSIAGLGYILLLCHCGAGVGSVDGRGEDAITLPQTDSTTKQEEQIQSQPNPTNGPMAPMPPAPPKPPPPPAPIGDTFTNYIDNQFRIYCRNCHIQDFLTVAEITDPTRRVEQRIVERTMPPRTVIPQADIDRIRVWFAKGSPQ